MTAPTIIPYRDWTGKKPPVRPPHRGDMSGGVVLHFAETDNSNLRTLEDCKRSMRGHRRYHQKTKGWIDIAYNWMVDPFGRIYEGRGFDDRNAANRPANGNTQSILWDGGPGDEPTPEALDAIHYQIQRCRDRGWALRVRGHAQAAGDNRSCPGPLNSHITVGRFGAPWQKPEPVPTPTKGRWLVVMKGKMVVAEFSLDDADTIRFR